MRMKTGGPGRQVMDTTYYTSILRAKTAEITTEIRSINGKVFTFIHVYSIDVQLETHTHTHTFFWIYFMYNLSLVAN